MKHKLKHKPLGTITLVLSLIIFVIMFAVMTIGSVTLDYDSLSVTRGSSVQTLPRKEFYLLYKLLSYPGKIFTRIQLMDEIWGMESQSDDNTINVHINRLRKRFEDYPEFTIETIRGLGYKAVKHL